MTGGSYDAVVIGGGPAGSTTALLLAQRGWQVALVEKSAFPRKKVCGEFISATNIPLLDRLGVGALWRAEAGPEIRRVGLFCGDRVAEAPMPAARSGPFGRALGRDVLDHALMEQARAAGVEVFQPWRAVSVEKHGVVQSVLIDGKGRQAVLTAPVIIAAHGSWETGKLPSQPDRVNRAGDLLGFKAHFLHASLRPDLMPLVVFPGGYGGLVWADRRRLSLSCCIRRDMLGMVRQKYGKLAAGEALSRHMMHACRGVREAIGGATLDGRWLAAGPMRPGIRAGYADDIFRVGNSAGECHPIVAEGITMAIQSAWLLASALAETRPRDPASRKLAGARYARAWRRLFELRVRSAAAFASIALSPVGRAGMQISVTALPQLQTIGAALIGKNRMPAEQI
jgi:flavin-dependent dehydrogenase